MTGAFDSALARLDAMLKGPFFSDDANEALAQLEQHRPAEMTAGQLRLLLGLCYRLTGVTGPALDITDRGEDQYGLERIGWHAETLIEQSFQDLTHDNRGYVQGRLDVRRAFLRPPAYDGEPDDTPVRPHVPLHRDAAAELLAPYLAHLETLKATDSTSHLKLCWDVLARPLPPFEGLFWAWLDEQGEGDAMRRARAFRHLVDGARQRASWADLRNTLLPQLQDEHPLVVTHCARFLGALFCGATERFVGENPVSLTEMLDHLRGLARHRRAAAGGFLDGFYSFDGGPLVELRRALVAEGSALDVEEWVIAILSTGEEEPFLPGSQMFWFHLHEHYCSDPAMVLRLIEAGHESIAWMCITELSPPAEGMEPLIERLAQSASPDLAQAAAALLADLGAVRS